MHAVLEKPPPEARPGHGKESHRDGRSSEIYPWTVAFFVFGVVVIGLVALMVCTGFFREYTELIREMSRF